VLSVRSNRYASKKGDRKGDRLTVEEKLAEWERALRDDSQGNTVEYNVACEATVKAMGAEIEAWRAAARADIAAEEAWAQVQGRGSGPEYERAKAAGYRATELRDIAREALKSP
jgi:hypothetical protein